MNYCAINSIFDVPLSTFSSNITIQLKVVASNYSPQNFPLEQNIEERLQPEGFKKC